MKPQRGSADLRLVVGRNVIAIIQALTQNKLDRAVGAHTTIDRIQVRSRVVLSVSIAWPGWRAQLAVPAYQAWRATNGLEEADTAAPRQTRGALSIARAQLVLPSIPARADWSSINGNKEKS